MTGSYLTLGPEGFGNYRVEVGLNGLTYASTDAPPEGVLCPPFVDLHVHGGFGIDFMSASSEDLVRLAGLLADHGYDAFLPTTVTSSPEAVQRALNELPEHPMLPGFHLEGPFISAMYPGAQPMEFIVEVLDDLGAWTDILEHPKLRIITLAPENPGALNLIDRLTSRGVLVSLGHTNATYAQALAAVEAGAAHTTHTFNAMRPLHHREAGVLGLALIDDRVSTEIIYDRVHVSREAARLLIEAKPPERLLAVSDGTLASGLPAGKEIEMWGHRCVVAENDVRLAESGALAGSRITLLDAFRNLARDFGPEIAIRACCLNPRRALNLPPPTSLLRFTPDYAQFDRVSLGV